MFPIAKYGLPVFGYIAVKVPISDEKPPSKPLKHLVFIYKNLPCSKLFRLSRNLPVVGRI